MLSPKNLHNYQKDCITHMLSHDNAMLWLQMGLGKTIITLTAIVELMNASKVKNTIIFGPLRVIESVWTTECDKWKHTSNLRLQILRGSEERRIELLSQDADIYLINYELMNWLAEYILNKKTNPFQCVIYDEVSKLKKSTSLRMKGGTRDIKGKKVKKIGWSKIIPSIKYRYGLTGTPASNGYLDLHGQFLAVDGGERLGKFITHYKRQYFTSDFNGWNFTITDANKKLIEQKISDITIKMDAKDYLEMPDVNVSNILVTFPSKIATKYKELEKNLFTELDSGEEVEVFNAASKTNKCLQFCNGSPYTGGKGEWTPFHDIKLQALEDVLEEAAGSPVLCSYTFRSDAERIMEHFKKFNPVNLTMTPSINTAKIIERWNKGDIKLLIGHPASMGHGIDGLQHNGSIIVWFGLNWNLELYEQMNARLNRQGQTKPVSIIHILCKDTVDMAVLDAIEKKHSNQEGLKDSLDLYRKK